MALLQAPYSSSTRKQQQGVKKNYSRKNVPVKQKLTRPELDNPDINKLNFYQIFIALNI